MSTGKEQPPGFVLGVEREREKKREREKERKRERTNGEEGEM